MICNCGNEAVVRTVKDFQFQLLEKDTTIMEMEVVMESKNERIKRLQLKNNFLEEEK